MTIVYMPLRVVGLLLRKFSRFNLPDSYHFPEIGLRYIFVSENPINKFSLESVQKYNWGEKSKKKIDFTISLNGKVHDGFDYLNIGIPKNSWFVCLHVRGSGFRGDPGRGEYRNPNISNYIPAIKKITSKGGFVVRMGDDTMKPLPRMKNVIDYPFTEYKSEFMDLCLIQNCRFFIGGQSGLQEFATLAFKDMLLVNIYEWCSVPTRVKDRGIHQHFYSKKKKRFLSTKELLTADLGSKDFFEIGNLNAGSNPYGCGTETSFIISENSPEEISKAVVEYMDFLNNDDFSLTSRQKEFMEFSKAQGHSLCERSRMSSPKTHNDENKLLNLSTYTARVERKQGTLCAGFLEDNW
jgi:putative glycosyltransferase (TIGR04372 family)